MRDILSTHSTVQNSIFPKSCTQQVPLGVPRPIQVRIQGQSQSIARSQDLQMDSLAVNQCVLQKLVNIVQKGGRNILNLFNSPILWRFGAFVRTLSMFQTLFAFCIDDRSKIR